MTRLLQARDATKSMPTVNNTSTSPNGIAPSSASRMSDKQVRDEVMTIFIAGHETTANALALSFYLLSQNPDIEKRLLDELASIIDSNRTSNCR